MRKVVRKILNCALVVLLLLALAAPVLGRSVATYPIRNKAEYKELLRSLDKIPSDFTAWGNAESFGEVVGFAAVSNGDTVAAGYEIVDKCGNTITLDIVFDAGPDNNEDVRKRTVSEDMVSMAIIPDFWSECKIIRGDFTYYYIPGANNTSMVRYIVWQQNGNRYAIGGAALDIYNDPVIQGLLSLDEKEFKAARRELSWNLRFTKVEQVLMFTIPAVAVVGIAVAAVVIVKKRKKHWKRCRQVLFKQIQFPET